MRTLQHVPALFLAALLAACTSPTTESAEPAPELEARTEGEVATNEPLLPDLAEELVAMAEADQEIREQLVTFVQEHPGEDPPMGLALKMLSGDAKRVARIQEIYAEHGFPTSEMVGVEASEAAWLLVQHADSVPDFQETVLEAIRPLVETGDVEKSDVALLTDRVLVARGEPQRYGTQYVTRKVDGETTFGPATPIADPEGLDRRREEMDLGPQAEYVEELRRLMGIPDEVPTQP